MPTRKIPATMATQHPDHAKRPYWHTTAFIATQQEAEEAYLSFSELGITEYKWDWEGKLVDESVLERLFGEHFDFFKKYPLGQERFLTFRLPNPKVETEFRIGRAFMNLASAASVAHHFKLPSPPLFEVILPMTETPEEIFAIQEAFSQMHELQHPLYRLDGILTNLRVIPLFEQVDVIMSADTTLKKYLNLYEKRFKKRPPYMRPYVARSDPALNSGMLATVLAIKIALSRFEKLEKEINIPMHPIIGAACLPFRGGISPTTVKEFANEYQGIRTTTIQSAFRYDFPKEQVVKAISYLEKTLPKGKTQEVTTKDEKILRSVISDSEILYKDVIEEIAPLINTVAASLPRRRERVQHVGLFGYSRGVGKVKLPRAISFTGALYSLGIPPEFIGMGRSLQRAQQEGSLGIVQQYYKNLISDLLRAGRYLNKDVLTTLAKRSTSFGKILQDVESVEKTLNITLGADTEEEYMHKELTDIIHKKVVLDEPPFDLITEAAMLRKSLG